MKERPSWFKGVIEGDTPLEAKEAEVVSPDTLHTALLGAKERAPINWTHDLDGETLHEYRSRMMEWSDEQLMGCLQDETLFDDLYFAKAVIDIASGRSVPIIGDPQ